MPALRNAIRPVVAAVVVSVSRPQHLVVDGDRLLVSDHATGTIVAVDLATAPDPANDARGAT